MPIEQDMLELINADVDGEISDAGREKLHSYLQSNPEAQQLHTEIAGLCQSLDTVGELEPPPHLRHLILDSLKKPARQERPATPFWKNFLVAPPLHYASMFAAGSLVTFLIVSSNQISDHAFDDITDLVGTTSSDVEGSGTTPTTTINLTDQALAGTVKAHRSGSIMVIDFDLSSVEPVEIIAEFTDRDVWFNGFAQLESDGTSVAAETGRVSMQMTGKRRYAMYLHNASGDAATINLRFLAAGEVIHEDILRFGGSD